MIYEDTYKEWKEDDIEILNERQPKSGNQVQDIILHGTDERRISKRQRCISTNCEEYFTNAVIGATMMARIDTLQPTDLIKKCIKNRGGKT